MREEGVPLQEIAVLFRSGWHSNELELELNACNIPFVKFGGLKFVEAAHIKDLVSILRILQNPRDAIAWHRVLLLFEGIGTKTAQNLITKILSRSDSYQAIAPDELGGAKYAGNLKKLFRLFNDKMRIELSPSENASLAAAFYKPLLKKNYDDFKKRINDLDSFAGLAERYTSLNSFLDDLSLHPPELSQTGSEASSQDKEKLTLSTIHSAKGLEWHTVFLISLIDGYLPSAQSLHRDQDTEEERRLLYVACTRAKQNLYLMRPQLARTQGFQPFGSGITFSETVSFSDPNGEIRRSIRRMGTK